MGPLSTQRSQRLGTVACKSQYIHPCPQDHTPEKSATPEESAEMVAETVDAALLLRLLART